MTSVDRSKKLFLSPSEYPERWKHLLDQNETVLWQGRPNRDVSFNFKSAFIGIIGCAFTVVAFGSLIESYVKSDSTNTTFGIIFSMVGIAAIVDSIYEAYYKRNRTYYALTNKRAIVFIDSLIRSKNIKLFPIVKDTAFELKTEYDSNGKKLTSILFAKHIRFDEDGSHLEDIGFERLLDGQIVYNLMRKVQESSQ